MHASPRLRRLRNDLLALERLREDSSVFSFTAHGSPPHHYQLTFKGRSLWRDRGQVRPLDVHRVEIKLGASYPRTMPEIRWITPIYHPNISEIGMVCLGGYGTNWVPSVQLDELCAMLWDMARYHNYDIRSPYNRDSALWAANQVGITFPTDPRPLRDLRLLKGRAVASSEESRDNIPNLPADPRRDSPQGRRTVRPAVASKVQRFARLYGLIFGSAGDPGVFVESISTRSRQTPEPASTAAHAMTPAAFEDAEPARAQPLPTLSDPPAEPAVETEETATRPAIVLSDSSDPAESLPHDEVVIREAVQLVQVDRPDLENADDEILFIA